MNGRLEGGARDAHIKEDVRASEPYRRASNWGNAFIVHLVPHAFRRFDMGIVVPRVRTATGMTDYPVQRIGWAILRDFPRAGELLGLQTVSERTYLTLAHISRK